MISAGEYLAKLSPKIVRSNNGQSTLGTISSGFKPENTESLERWFGTVMTAPRLCSLAAID